MGGEESRPAADERLEPNRAGGEAAEPGDEQGDDGQQEADHQGKHEAHHPAQNDDGDGVGRAGLDEPFSSDPDGIGNDHDDRKRAARQSRPTDGER